MEKTIVVLGAGRGLGAGVARTFGANGYRVALVARHSKPLAEIASTLSADGITAEIFGADLTDLAAIPTLFGRIRDRFGGVDVVYFGPGSTTGFTPAETVTAQQIAAFVALYTYPTIEVVRAVLPEMLGRGSGTILYANGAAGVRATAGLSGGAPAVAAARNYLQTLSAEVGERGVYVGALFIAGLIAGTPNHEEAAKWDPDGTFPVVAAADLAAVLWQMHTLQATFETVVPQI
jgi:NADP-dependent 3-hydroxy acid dehydrogenase YdfG